MSSSNQHQRARAIAFLRSHLEIERHLRRLDIDEERTGLAASMHQTYETVLAKMWSRQLLSPLQLRQTKSRGQRCFTPSRVTARSATRGGLTRLRP